MYKASTPAGDYLVLSSLVPENPQVTEPPWKEAVEVNDLKREKSRASHQPYEHITEKPKLRNRKKYRGFTTSITTIYGKQQKPSGTQGSFIIF